MLILDNNTNHVLSSATMNIKPYLIVTTNTDPPQLLYCAFREDGAFTFANDGYTINSNVAEVSNYNISSVVLATDGKSIYNNHNPGIYRMRLPITDDSSQFVAVQYCYTVPWLYTISSAESVFATCLSARPGGHPVNISGFNNDGTAMWGTNVSIDVQYTMIDDDESMVIVGTDAAWIGVNITDGDVLFNLTIADITINTDSNAFMCYCVTGPWANRHPIIFPNHMLAILCGNHNVFDVRLVNTMTGKLQGAPMVFTQLTQIDILFADNSNLYGVGYANANQSIIVEKLAMQ